MHETAVAEALLARVEDEASARGAVEVTRIAVRVGEAAGVEAELLARAFALLAGRSRAGRAVLDVTTEPVAWSCPACGVELERGAILRCPGCDVPARLARGGEIVLDRIEMEVP